MMPSAFTALNQSENRRQHWLSKVNTKTNKTQTKQNRAHYITKLRRRHDSAAAAEIFIVVVITLKKS